MPLPTRSSQKRERLNGGSDALYVKRSAKGTFEESDDVGRSQQVDQPRRAKKTVASGYVDQGDRRKKR